MTSMMPLNDAEIQDIAGAAADAAVRKLFLTMGVDTSDDKAMIEMQKDFAHTRESRLAIAAIKTRAYLVATGIVISGVLGAIWLAFKGQH